MKVVIEIPDSIYSALCSETYPIQDAYKIALCVKKGTPLPEHHGRLIDADALWRKWVFDAIGKQEIDEAPTIIEADKGENK